MEHSGNDENAPVLLPIVLIALSIGVVAAAFAYTAGWLTPRRLSPEKLVTAVQPPTGPVLGHRRNHAKGICFTGVFNANGAGAQISKATMLREGSYPVTGRFNIGGGDPGTPDPMAQVRGLSLRITTADGQDWRSAMIDAPIFAAPTPQAFFEFLSATASKNPDAFKQYSSRHPEVLTFISWAKSHPRSESWSEDRFNSLNSFVFVDSAGTKRTVRWSFVPEEKAAILSPDALAKRNPDFLQQDIAKRVSAGPLRWRLIVTLSQPGDITSDPTRLWPTDRKTVDAGTLIVTQVQQEADGPCRDINFDPAVLPPGMTTSDDSFPAARSSAYRVSYNDRLAESSHYPHTQTGGRP